MEHNLFSNAFEVNHHHFSIGIWDINHARSSNGQIELDNWTWIKICVLAEPEGPTSSTTLPTRRGTLWRGGTTKEVRSLRTLPSISEALSSPSIHWPSAIRTPLVAWPAGWGWGFGEKSPEREPLQRDLRHFLFHFFFYRGGEFSIH